MEYVLTADKYAQSLREGKFLGLKCRRCETYTVPPQKVCSACLSEEMDVIELSRKGTLRSFTVIYTAAEGFQAPYIVGLVELSEGPWVTVSVINLNPELATINIIGKSGRVDYKEVLADAYSGGSRIALTFHINQPTENQS